MLFLICEREQTCLLVTLEHPCFAFVYFDLQKDAVNNKRACWTCEAVTIASKRFSLCAKSTRKAQKQGEILGDGARGTDHLSCSRANISLDDPILSAYFFMHY